MNGFDEFLRRTEDANVVPVIETMPADLLTPLAVYLKLFKGEGESFLLESVEGGETLARYSFVGVDPKFTVSGSDRQVTIRNAGGSNTIEQGMIDFLRDHFAKNRLAESDDLPSFAGGAIGSLAFSCSAWFEPSLKPSVVQTDDEAAFMFCRTIVAFDHAKQVIKIVSLVFTDEAGGDAGQLREIYHAAIRANRATRETLDTGQIKIPATPSKIERDGCISNFEKADFENAVRTIKEHIAAGDAYQVVLSQCFSLAT